jgi:hypothetical protein
MKIGLSVLLSAFLIVVVPAAASPPDRMAGVGWADRQNNKGVAGRCPVGTCSRIGTPFAKNLNMCRASNCPPGGPR